MGHLVVAGPALSKTDGAAAWAVRCDCGATTARAPRSHLTPAPSAPRRAPRPPRSPELGRRAALEGTKMTKAEMVEVAARADAADTEARKALDVYKRKTRTGKDLRALKMIEGILQTFEALRLERAS